MKISTIFIIDAVDFNEQQISAFKSLFAEWVVVNRNTARMLISALIDDQYFNAAVSALSQYDLAVVGKWDKDGNQLTAVNNVSEYVALLPEKFEVVSGAFVQVAHTAAVDVVGWSGWSGRQFD